MNFGLLRACVYLCTLFLSLTHITYGKELGSNEKDTLTQTCEIGNIIEVNVSGSHLVSPTYLKNASTCQYRLNRLENVCQVRLDFRKFESNHITVDEYGKPFSDGNCNDTLTFTGASNTNNLGPLCGNLTGQHINLDFGFSNEILMFIHIATVLPNKQNWDIQVSFIKNDSTERAPTGCLQYFTEEAGRVTSFNYNAKQQLNNQDYSVCIKPSQGMTRIFWNSCGGFDDFVVTGMRPTLAPPLPPLIQPSQGDLCTTDWIMIFGVDKYCGNFFSGVVTSITMPYLLQVHFDSVEFAPPPSGKSDLDNTGFCLMYQLRP